MKITERQMELINRAGRCYAACYLLMTVAMDYADAGDEACKAAGYHRNDIKMESGRVQAAFDRFCKTFSKYIGQGDSRVILKDYEEIKPKIEEILEVEL